ncbi:sodium:solute symporter family transporter [Streptomyces sp. SYSU K21746]
MNQYDVLAAGSDSAAPLISFLLVISVCFLLCLMVGTGEDDIAEFFAAGRSLPAVRNALALAGDYIPATALLSPVGAVGLSGSDGVVVAVSAVAALGVLLLLAGPVRDTGRFTLGGILANRPEDKPARISAALITVLVCVPLTVVQLTVAGAATAYLLGLDSAGAEQVCTGLIGLLMVTFAAFGGMRGTTLIQVGKAVVVFVTLLAVVLAVLSRFRWDFGALLNAAGQGSGPAGAFGSLGQLYGGSTTGKLELLSLCVTVALGSAAVPPVLMRVGTSLSTRTARKSARYTFVMIAFFNGAVVLLGLGAAAVVGVPAIIADDPQGNSALFLLSHDLTGGRGGNVLVTMVACAVFVTSLGTVAGLTLAAAAALAHDLFGEFRRRGRVVERDEVGVARWAVVVLGALSVLLALLLHGWSIVFLASFAAAVAASVILPALIYRFFWKGFTRVGLMWTIHGSLACCLLLQLFSPTVSGRPFALFPAQDFQWFPLQNIALVSVPVGFALGWMGSHVSRRIPTTSRHGRARDTQDHAG